VFRLCNVRRNVELHGNHASEPSLGGRPDQN
jgi:hypothetical protein